MHDHGKKDNFYYLEKSNIFVFSHFWHSVLNYRRSTSALWLAVVLKLLLILKGKNVKYYFFFLIQDKETHFKINKVSQLILNN